MPKGRRANHKGRSKFDGPFLALEHWFLNSPAWRALRPVERAIFIEVAQLYRGENNGTLAMSARRAAQLTRCNKDTAAKALKLLCDAGFLHVVTPGGFSRKDRMASEYAVDLWPDNVGEHKDQPALKRFARRPPTPDEKNNGPKRRPHPALVWDRDRARG